MKARWFATMVAVLISTAALMGLLFLVGKASNISQPARAAPQDAPTVMAVDPASAPNDLDTPIVITGTGFTAGLTVTLGNTRLPDATWVSGTTLTATVPWGLNPGVYTLTVVNPDGQSGSLPNVFTVTQGIGVWTTGGPYGGLVQEIVINPITPTTLYAKVMPAVFRSRDGGHTWKPIRIDISYGPLVMDPLAPDTLYVKGSDGALVYRTDDGGDSWVALPEIMPGCQAPLIFAHPLISGTIYGSTGAGLWKSEDRGQTWITWTHNLTDSNVTGMAFHPTNPLKLYVGTYHGNTFRSDDGGESWQFMGQASHQVSNLTVNPFIPDELWALRPYGGGGYGQGLSKYESGSWTPVFTTPVYAFVASRNISGTMWIGTAWNGSLKSTDGGHTWLPFGTLPPGNVVGLAVDPTDSNIVYRGAGGRGVYKTTDDGATFYPVNNGLAGIVPTAMAVMPGNPSAVYAVENGVGTFKTNNGGGSWLQLPNENRWLATVGVDPITPTRVYLATGGEYVDISDDGGYNWHRAVLSAPVHYQDCAVENQAMIVNAGLPGHLVMGVGFLPGGDTSDYIAGGIYTSTDYGESWTYVDVGHPISAVVSLAYDPLSPTVIYAGTGAYYPENAIGYGELLKSRDGGNTWQSSSTGLPRNEVSQIAVEPGSAHRVFVKVDELYVSTNGGASWIAVSSPPAHTGSIFVFAPGDPPILYGGTDSGLYRSIDGAQSWQQAAGTLGSVNVRALAVGEAQDRVILYVSTAGGMVSGGATQAQSLASGETLVSAGVYRYMIQQLHVYLPVILKGRRP